MKIEGSLLKNGFILSLLLLYIGFFFFFFIKPAILFWHFNVMIYLGKIDCQAYKNS